MIDRRRSFALLLAVPLFVRAQASGRVPPSNTRPFFTAPANGQAIRGDVVVRFGLRGEGPVPGGVVRVFLLVDTDALPARGLAIAPDANRIALAGGQTETTLKLAPGQHLLQLLLTDADGVPYDPPVLSEQLAITVQ